MSLHFFDPHITMASLPDIPAIRKLLNSAYRGESSRQGWTTEADLIAGEQRANDHMLTEVMQQPGSVILKYTNDEGQITGCVNLQKMDNRVYLGMFSVTPILQGKGIGKKLLQAAEAYALYIKCTAIYMSVISVRTVLISWYERHGYKDTGTRNPFKEDGITGKHLQELEFMILEKKINKPQD